MTSRMDSLEVVQGRDVGMVFYIDDTATLGRALTNTICIADSRASREHAVIRKTPRNITITDLGSGNGTYINGVKIKANRPEPLRDGDQIRLCNTEFLYRRQADSVGSGSTTLSAVITQDERECEPMIGATLDARQNLAEIGHQETQSTDRLLEALKRLQAMVRVSSDLAAVTGHLSLLERIMRSIFDVFPLADRAFVLLRDPASGEMRPAMGRSRKQDSSSKHENRTISISRTVLNTVVKDKQSILSSDAQTDDRFGGAESIANLRIRSMMVAPLLCNDEILGVLHLDSAVQAKAFQPNDLAMLTGIASQAAIALKNAELYEAVQEETERRTLLSRYMSPDVVQGVLEGQVSLDMNPKTANGTIIFCDILGFTAMSESLSPVDVVQRLNRYYRLTTDIVSSNKGTLHKFGGDMIMAFWNVMFEDPRHEYNSARTGLMLQRAVWGFNLNLLEENQQPIHLGVGCNTGSFAAGNVGGEGYMEYTIIGDNVNVAQRIESLSSRWQVMISESTYQAIHEESIAVRLPPVTVKGRSIPVNLFSIRGLLEEDGTLCLCFPVLIIGSDGQQAGSGLIRRARNIGDDAEIDIISPIDLEAGNAVVLQAQLLELSEPAKLGARVRGCTPSPEHAGFLVRLGDLRGDEFSMSLLKPGTCIESTKTWDAMKRG